MRLTIRRSRIHGVGVFAEGDCAQGRPLGVLNGEYVGRVDEFEQLPTVGLVMPDGRVHVPTSGFPLWLTNYSCNPNVYFRALSAVALRDIRAGDELTVAPVEPLPACRCSACRLEKM